MGDGITNDNTLTLTGTAEANSTVKVYDGATLLGSVTANGSGAWSYTTAALTNGAHSLTATATDAAGNTGVASTALAVTIDTTAPVAPTIASFSTDSGVVGDGITNDNTLTLTGTAEANSTVKVYDGATLLGSAAANGTGPGATRRGAHQWRPQPDCHRDRCRRQYRRGLERAAVTIDTTAPVVTQTVATPSSGIEFPGDTVTVTLTLSEAVTVSGTPTLALNDGGTATYTGGSGSNALTFSYTVGASDATVSALAITAANLLNGAKITDAAGNPANLSAALVTFAGLQIDPPTMPVAPTITSFSTDSGVVGDHITNDNTLTLTGTAEANSTVKVYDGATLLGNTATDASGTWSYTTAALVDGGHSLTATAHRCGRNTSATSTALAVTVDTVAPASPVLTTKIATGSFALFGAGLPNLTATVSIFDSASGALVGTALAAASGSWSFMKVRSDGNHL